MIIMMKSYIKIPDVLIILMAASLVFFSAHRAYIKPQGKAQVLIRGQESEWSFPINAEETVLVSGPLGNTVIKIGGNFAWVESSPCSNQTCVASGNVQRQGQWAACLPNNVLLMVQGSSEPDSNTKDENVDAVVR